MNWGQSRKRVLSSAAAALLAVGVPGAAQAAVSTTGCIGTTSCTLQELFDGGSISSDNFTFDNWSLDLDDTEFNPSNVTVTGFDDFTPITGRPDASVIGLDFVFDPDLVPAPSIDVDFDWDANASGSGVFTFIGLDLTGFDTPGDSFVEININLIGPGGSLNVSAPTGLGPTDGQTLASITGFSQDTDIKSQVGATSGTPSLDSFRVVYLVEGRESSMPPTDMPEPASFAMLAFGLACLGAMTRRRSGLRADPT